MHEAASPSTKPPTPLRIRRWFSPVITASVTVTLVALLVLGVTLWRMFGPTTNPTQDVLTRAANVSLGAQGLPASDERYRFQRLTVTTTHDDHGFHYAATTVKSTRIDATGFAHWSYTDVIPAFFDADEFSRWHSLGQPTLNGLIPPTDGNGPVTLHWGAEDVPVGDVARHLPSDREDIVGLLREFSPVNDPLDGAARVLLTPGIDGVSQAAIFRALIVDTDITVTGASAPDRLRGVGPTAELTSSGGVTITLDLDDGTPTRLTMADGTIITVGGDGVVTCNHLEGPGGPRELTVGCRTQNAGTAQPQTIEEIQWDNWGADVAVGLGELNEQPVLLTMSNLSRCGHNLRLYTTLNVQEWTEEDEERAKRAAAEGRDITTDILPAPSDSAEDAPRQLFTENYACHG